MCELNDSRSTMEGSTRKQATAEFFSLVVVVNDHKAFGRPCSTRQHIIVDNNNNQTSMNRSNVNPYMTTYFYLMSYSKTAAAVLILLMNGSRRSLLVAAGLVGRTITIGRIGIASGTSHLVIAVASPHAGDQKLVNATTTTPTDEAARDPTKMSVSSSMETTVDSVFSMRWCQPPDC